RASTAAPGPHKPRQGNPPAARLGIAEYWRLPCPSHAAPPAPWEAIRADFARGGRSRARSHKLARIDRSCCQCHRRETVAQDPERNLYRDRPSDPTGNKTDPWQIAQIRSRIVSHLRT